VVRDLNWFLRGWAGYFRYGNSSHQIDKIRKYALSRLALIVAKRHQRPRPYGWRRVAYQSSDQYGLISLDGVVIAPRPGKPWRLPAERWR
jgi:RNA-directed DNA polymerase